jgi:L-asparagine transporter-like permease
MMRGEEWDELDVKLAAILVAVILAMIAAGFAFIANDSPQEMDGSNAGANAATVEQIRDQP